MDCHHCSGLCIKAGRSRNGAQRYHCNTCDKYQQQTYIHRAFNKDVNDSIVKLLTEGVGIRGISRVLKISTTTVIARIKRMASSLHPKPIMNRTGIYEIDELWTYIGKKQNEAWVTYALDRATRDVIDFVVGPRTKEHLSKITSAALAATPLKVCTDGLSTYRSLVPTDIHHVGLSHTRHIERFNLNLRTHLKRLTRKTICFSRSVAMLESCLRIYFWGTFHVRS